MYAQTGGILPAINTGLQVAWDNLAMTSSAHGCDAACLKDIYRRLRERFDNVGTVVQSCLHRTADDVARLLDQGIAHLRLCKGIYIEPEDIAYTDADDIRDSYRSLLVQMFEGGAIKVGIATHDPLLVDHAEQTIRAMNIDKSRYEFQMLLGVREHLRREILERGHRMRVYVPFGSHWYAYSVRRLKENPQIAGHVLRGILNGKA